MADVKRGEWHQAGDSFVYWAACILSLGTLWIIRVVITKAVLFAIQQDRTNLTPEQQAERNLFEEYNARQ